MNPVVTWLFSLMLWLAPPAKLAQLSGYPGSLETVEERTSRYHDIAQDLYSVAYDVDEPSVFGGGQGRAKTATLMLSLAYIESGFAKDVDNGPCYRGKGSRGRCDHGLSACLMQIHVGEGKTVEGWTREDLFADRQKCFRAALHRIRSSVASCQDLSEELRLSSYASGSCAKGHLESRSRWALANRVFRHDTIPGNDVLFLLPPSHRTAGTLALRAP